MADFRAMYNDLFLPNGLAHNLISKVDKNVDRDKNLAVLINVGLQKDDLKGIVTYLKDNFSDTYPTATEKLNIKQHNITKAGLLNQILDFVIYTIPSLCLKCDEKYVPYAQNNSANDDVVCFACKLPAHRECYTAADVNFHLVFLCEICVTGERKEPTVTVRTEHGTEKEDTTDEESTKSPKKVERKSPDKSQNHVNVDSGDTTTTTDEEEKKRRKKKYKRRSERYEKIEIIVKKDQVCPLLIEGKCPHGIGGKQCEYKHKNMCYKYCSFGTKDMHRGGCGFGDNCRYLHPILCQNSVINRTCFSESCTNGHLRYTRRK